MSKSEQTKRLEVHRSDTLELAELRELSHRLDAIEAWTAGERVKVGEADAPAYRYHPPKAKPPALPPLPGRQIAEEEIQAGYRTIASHGASEDSFRVWLAGVINSAILADRAACGRGVAAERGEVERA